jgi:hypothetical protein
MLMALRDWLYASHPAATTTTATSATNERPEQENVAKVADVAVANAGKSKADGEYEAASALASAKTIDKPIPASKVTGMAVSAIKDSKDQERDLPFVRKHSPTATISTTGTPATSSFKASKAVAKARDPKTGELVPHRLAMIEPMPGDELRARLSKVRPRSHPHEIHLVDILCPAHSGGMKGFSIRVDQLPELIRTLLDVQEQALERGLLSPPTATGRSNT